MLLQLGMQQAFSHKALLSYFLNMVEFFGKVGDGNWSYADSLGLWENGQMEGCDAGKQTFQDGNCQLAKLYIF